MSIYGLFVVVDEQNNTAKEAVPLTAVHADIKIIDCVSHVTLKHTYKNVLDKRLEAIYKFPIDNKAAICQFEAQFDDGRIIKGIVKEKENAAKEYKVAVSQGFQAALLEQEKADIFQSSIGNINPRQNVTITISYVAEIDNDDDNQKLRFVLPTTVAPRYHSTKHADNDSGGNILAGQAVNDILATYKLSIDCLVQMAGRITSIESTSHPISVNLQQPGNTSAKVNLAKNDVLLDKDFVLIVKSDNFDIPRATCEYNAETKTNCVMLTMVPRFNLTSELKGEYIFIVDRSGSMGGFKIEKTREALQLFMKSLPEDSYFNIIGFGSSFSLLFQESKAYTDDAVKQAVFHINSIDADMGGTEIYDPINKLLSLPLKDGYSRQIFILTDGEVSNVDSIKQVVTNTVSTQRNTRFFAVGIGNAVSRELVEGIATCGKGALQYVMEGERMEKKILLLLKQATQKEFRNLTVEWCDTSLIKVEKETKTQEKKGGVLSFFSADVEVKLEKDKKPSKPINSYLIQQAPSDVPPLFVGKRFIVYAMMKESVKVPENIKIHAETTDGPIELSVPVKAETSQNNSKFLHLLAARALIQDLENEKCFASVKTPFTGEWDGFVWVTSKPSKEDFKDEIIRLGTLFQLMSQHTSFVAIDPSDNKTNTALSLQTVVVSTRMDLGGHQGIPPNPKVGLRTTALPMVAPSIQFGAAPGPTMSMAFGAPPPPPPTSMMFGAAPSTPSHFSAPFCPPPSAPKPSATGAPLRNMKKSKKSAIRFESEEANEISAMDDAVPEMEPNSTKQDPHNLLLSLISFQGVSGAFEANDSISSIISVNIKDTWLKFSTSRNLETADKSLFQVWVTMIIMTYLETKLASLKDEWELVYGKAQKWVQKTLSNASLGSQEEWAKEVKAVM